MSNEEIYRRIGLDVYTIGKSGGDVTIWMTKDLYHRLLLETLVLYASGSKKELFGCRIKVVDFPCGGMQWIVGYEGTADEGE